VPPQSFVTLGPDGMSIEPFRLIPTPAD
jgi:hypothetical protein